MKVAHRLFLSVLPAVLGVLAIAAIADQGCEHHGVTWTLLAAAAVAAGGSLVVAWWNARDLTRHVESLSRFNGVSDDATEPDVYGGSIRELAATQDELAAGAAPHTEADHRVRAYAALVGGVADVVQSRIAEIRLPLHILLESHFGELNENQEEMLAAAQEAANAADAELRRIQLVVELDRGNVEVQPELVRMVDLVAPLLPALAARALATATHVQSDVSPRLPHVRVDRQLTHQALALVLDEVFPAAGPSGALTLTAIEEPENVQLLISHTAGTIALTRLAIAVRLLEAQSGALTSLSGRCTVTLPRDGARANSK